MEDKTVSQELLKKATEEGTVPPPFLQLATQIKDEDGKLKGVKGTGRHTVIFVSDQIVEGEDFKTKEKRQEVQYIFEEGGQKKKYKVPVHNKNGELHYFVQRMAEVKRSETITLEYKKIPNSFKGYIEVGKLSDAKPPSSVSPAKKELKEEDIPIIEGDEGEIDVSEIPF